MDRWIVEDNIHGMWKISSIDTAGIIMTQDKYIQFFFVWKKKEEKSTNKIADAS